MDRECDWVAKYHLVEAYRGRHGLALSDPRVLLLDLQYHDVDRQRGLYYRMQDRGLMERTTTDRDIAMAVEEAPATTRARLRGDFIRRAKERRRDFTVDWVHLKLNDQAQRTVFARTRSGGRTSGWKLIESPLTERWSLEVLVGPLGNACSTDHVVGRKVRSWPAWSNSNDS
ncbi:MAG: hypothetical protein CM1200mP26_11590 [Acidimicrobiales bacterium]|nr:MAG: hypothetical protein CM1200mP26_11590 [Acidimicrobiales bacterium]